MRRNPSRRIGCDAQAACGFPADSLSRVHRLTKKQARQVAVRAQLLDAPRPKDLLAVVERLTLLQVDPTAAIAPQAGDVLKLSKKHAVRFKQGE